MHMNIAPNDEIARQHIAASVSHLLTDPDARVELLDEIMEQGTIRRDLLTAALRVVKETAPESIHHEEALDTIAIVMQQQAQSRATADWQRLIESPAEGVS